MPDHSDYNSDEEDLYGPGPSSKSAPSAPQAPASSTSFTTLALHFKVTEETLGEARGFLNVATVSIFH